MGGHQVVEVLGDGGNVVGRERRELVPAEPCGQGAGFRVQGSGFRVQGSGSRVLLNQGSAACPHTVGCGGGCNQDEGVIECPFRERLYTSPYEGHATPPSS